MVLRLVVILLIFSYSGGTAFSDESLKVVQQVLQYTGHYQGKPTGNQDSKTATAMQEFYKEYQTISRDGKVDRKENSSSALIYVMQSCLAPETKDNAKRQKEMDDCFKYTSNRPRNRSSDVFDKMSLQKIISSVEGCGSKISEPVLTDAAKLAFKQERVLDWKAMFSQIGSLYSETLTVKDKKGESFCLLFQEAAKQANVMKELMLLVSTLSMQIRILKDNGIVN